MSLRPKDQASDMRRLKALIHVGKRELGLDEDGYRALLARIAGKPSSADMTRRELKAVADEMRRLGFKPLAGAAKEDPQHRMIAGLWREMADAGIVKDGSSRALDRFTKRVTGIDRVVWLPAEDANKVIEALKAWKAREK